MKVANRTFVISGGSSGLGLSTASLLLSHSANVSILDLNPPPESPISALKDADRTLFTPTDVSSTSSLTDALSQTLTWVEKTKKPLGGIICCAGIGYGEKALPRQSPDVTPETVKHMDIAKFDRVISINLRGTVDLLRLSLPHLALNNPEGPDGERGVVILVSSIAAVEGQVGQLAYSASKGAVRSIVLPLAREVGQQAGIRVMGIAPGVFETGMTTRPSPKGPNLAPGGKPKAHAGDNGKVTSQKTKSRPTMGGTGAKVGINPEMVNYPLRMGKGEEFARLVREIVENPMLNGEVIRLDGGVRMPSRL